MSLKSRIRKNGNDLISTLAKNPYYIDCEKKSFPLWAKIVIPFASILSVGLVVTIVLVNTIGIKQDLDLKKFSLNEVNKQFNMWDGELSNDFLQSINDYGNNFFKKDYSIKFVETHKGKNILFSPILNQISNNILYDGLDEVGKNEYEDCLSIQNKSDRLAQIKHAIQSLTIEGSTENGLTYRSNLSTGLFFRNVTDSIKSDYLDLLTNYYYADAFGGDFSDNQISEYIYSYLNNETNGTFFGFLSNAYPEESNKLMYLASTSYLDADWRISMTKSLVQMAFNDSLGNSQLYDYLIGEFTSFVYSTENYSIISIPLAGDYAFDILLPKDDDNFLEILNNSYEALTSYEPNNQRFNIHLYLPCFKEYVYNDLGVMNYLLGLRKSSFSSDDVNRAHYSSITDDEAFNVECAFQGSYLEINEKGVVATSITKANGIAEAGGSEDLENITFNVNKPFSFMIKNKNKIPFYYGTIGTL